MVKGKAGFTLLEVILSIAIIGIILTSLYSSFFVSQRAVDGLDEVLTRLQEMRMAIEMMRMELEATCFSTERPYTLFRIEGRDIYGRNASSVTFTNFSSLQPGLIRTSYRIDEREGERLILVKETSSIGKGDGKGAEKAIVEVLEDIESFTVMARYGDEWVKTWDDKLTREVPEEVRLEVSLKIKGKEYTLSDMARLRIGRRI